MAISSLPRVILCPGSVSHHFRRLASHLRGCNRNCSLCFGCPLSSPQVCLEKGVYSRLFPNHCYPFSYPHHIVCAQPQASSKRGQASTSRIKMRRHPTDPRSHHAESDRHSTTTGLHGATGPSAFIFAPLWDDIGRAVWTTEVDRILVLSVEVTGTATIWLRLIGPRNALNLKPSTKVTRQSILRWRWTRKPCPNRTRIWRSIGLEHAGARSQTYTSQHGLGEWPITRTGALAWNAEVLTWALVIHHKFTWTTTDRSPYSKFSRAWVRERLLPW